MLLELELQHWTLFTNLHYNSQVIENLFVNTLDLVQIKNPQLLGKMLAKRPLRGHIIAVMRGSHITQRLREEPELLDSNVDLAVVLHKQLIYYSLEFPEWEDELKQFVSVLEANKHDKALDDIKTEIAMF